MRLSHALLIAALVAAFPSPAHARQRSGIIGTVADTVGAMLGNVEVSLIGTTHLVSTNDKGEFRLAKVKSGHYTLSMRRVGFEPLTMPIDIVDGNAMELDFELTPTQVRLAAFTVAATNISAKLRRVGFEARLHNSGVPASHFFTRAEIEKRNPVSLAYLVERLGGRSRGCADANVFLDGMPAVGVSNASMSPNRGVAARSPGRSTESSFPKVRMLEYVPVRTVEGMEVYTSVSEIPAEYKSGPDGRVTGNCVVLLWTRER